MHFSPPLSLVLYCNRFTFLLFLKVVARLVMLGCHVRAACHIKISCLSLIPATRKLKHEVHMLVSSLGNGNDALLKFFQKEGGALNVAQLQSTIGIIRSREYCQKNYWGRMNKYVCFLLSQPPQYLGLQACTVTHSSKFFLMPELCH